MYLPKDFETQDFRPSFLNGNHVVVDSATSSPNIYISHVINIYILKPDVSIATEMKINPNFYWDVLRIPSRSTRKVAYANPGGCKQTLRICEPGRDAKNNYEGVVFIKYTIKAGKKKRIYFFLVYMTLK